MAQLRQAAGAAAESVELDQPCSVGDLIKCLADRHGGSFRELLLDAGGGVRPAVLLFVGDEQVGPERPLRDGDVATVLTPMAGG
jgi:molybdopterin converting factor small subunit